MHPREAQGRSPALPNPAPPPPKTTWPAPQNFATAGHAVLPIDVPAVGILFHRAGGGGGRGAVLKTKTNLCLDRVHLDALFAVAHMSVCVWGRRNRRGLTAAPQYVAWRMLPDE